MMQKISLNESIKNMQKVAKDWYMIAYDRGWEDGSAAAKERYGNQANGIAKVNRATPEQMLNWGKDLWGWCTECEKPIEGRWVGMINFCPWCGRVIEFEKPEEYKERVNGCADEMC